MRNRFQIRSFFRLESFIILKISTDKKKIYLILVDYTVHIVENNILRRFTSTCAPLICFEKL